MAKATCHACRIMKTTCDAEGEICIPCQKQDFKCIRTSSQPLGPPPQEPHQRGLVSHLIQRAEAKSKFARWAKDSEGENLDPATKLSKMASTACLSPRPSTCRLAENDLPVVSPTVNDLTPLTSPTKDTPTELNQHKAFHSSGFCLEQKVTKTYLPPCNPNDNKTLYPLLSFPAAPTQTQQSDQARKKKLRAAEACISCRSLMAKCDEGRPGCTRCKEQGTECVYQSEIPTCRNRPEPYVLYLRSWYNMLTFLPRIPYLIPGQRAFSVCDRCRNERGKCDEGVPSCTLCKESGVECVYKGRCLAPVSEPDNISPQPPLRKRVQRAAQACENCRNLKAKCDERKPCTSCKEKGICCKYRERWPKQYVYQVR